MNNDIYDILEACLQSIEHGAHVETLLARYPQFADELRPLLKAALSARAMPISSPSASGMRRGRSQLLQKAAEMREAKVAPRSRRSVIPMIQRLAITLGLTTAFVFSGTGLVGASSTALPGENLYPVKRTWEGVRLLFVFNTDSRDALESKYEQERLHEASELLAEGRYEMIQFSGVYTQVNGKDYISGIPALFNSNTLKPIDLINGAAVTINGYTNADGFILIETIAVLPPGSSVPLGQPIEEESQSENNNDSSGSGSSSGQDTAPKPESHDGEDKFKIEGTIDSLQGTEVKVNGQTMYVENAQVEGSLKLGANVEVEGYYTADGKFIVTKIKVKDSGPSNGGDNNNSGSGSDSSSGGGDNSGNGSDDSGGGGGSGEDSGNTNESHD